MGLTFGLTVALVQQPVVKIGWLFGVQHLL